MMTVPRCVDIAVVGGGIAGGALATALARSGLEVTVLEATEHYEDRVRGETMQPWGVREARELGVEEALLSRGAYVNTMVRHYSAGSATSDDLPMGAMVDGIPGSLNLGHPAACDALTYAAAAAGATVVRGVREIAVTPGESPSLSFTAGEVRQEVAARLIVGADGRASAVRRQSGLRLHRQRPASFIAGMLLEALDVPDDGDVLAAGTEFFVVLFHQGGGRARAYVCGGMSQKQRFAGARRRDEFLGACATAPFPHAAGLAAGTPAGPVKAYPGEDTWMATPAIDGVVLIGDAAGYNDPIIAQGLSISMRDARIVRDLVLNGARRAVDFAEYGRERERRMQTLRFVADLVAIAYAEDAPNRDARRDYLASSIAQGDPHVMTLMGAVFAGPELVPPELLSDELLDRVRAA